MRSESTFEEIRRFLPQYLSAEAELDLFAALSQFPDSIDSRMYSLRLVGENTFFQGDGVHGMPFVNLPNPKVDSLPAMVLSNTCDMSADNVRIDPIRVMYAPVYNLEKYDRALRQADPSREGKITDYVESIRKQRVSNIFYLPSGSGGLDYEGMVPLDRIQNAPVSQLRENGIPADRLFSLGDYGFYILLFKLSIHFSRIREGVKRS